MSVEAIIEKKRELEEQIQDAKCSVNRLPDMQAKAIELSEWRGRLENLVYLCGNDMNRVMTTRAADYRQIKDTIDRLSDEVQREKKKADDAKQHLADLENELAGLDAQVSLKELLAFQKKMMLAENSVIELEELMKEQKSKIDGVNKIGGARDSCSKTLASLSERKENLLADIACGKEVDKALLAALDQQITEAEAKHDEHINSAVTANQTISGLHRKLSSANGELTLAKRNYLDAAAVYLGEEIELAGSEYVKLTNQVATQFMRIVALAELRGKIGKPTNVFGTYTALCEIPSFATDSCKGHEIPDYPGLLFNYQRAVISESIQKEISRLREEGLKLPL